MNVNCPDCDGTGRRYALINLGIRGCQGGVSQCTRCRGSGRVAKTVLSWIARGEELRKQRRKRGLTIHAEARRLGIYVYELDDMECGRREPIDYELEKQAIERMIDERA